MPMCRTWLGCPSPADERAALLVRALWGYRELGCDLTRSAAALGVHRSTMRYRLYRVRELTGLSPEDPRSAEALHAVAGLHP
jgi:sugar diacid utilization regulator